MKKIAQLLPRDANLRILLAFAVCIVLGLALSSIGHQLFSARNITSMAYLIPEFGLLALAMTLVMLTGGIDLSVVANANLSGIIGGFILAGALLGPAAPDGAVLAAAVAAVLACATVCGALNGVLIAKCSIPPILATLATMIFFSGVGMAITNGQGVVGFPASFLRLGTMTVIGVPFIFWMLIAASACAIFVLGRCKIGREIYFMGENPVASRYTGIKNERLIIITYAAAGFLVGLASIIITSRVNSAKVGYGDTYILQSILVCVLGGVNPYGGRGKVAGVLVGIVLLQLLANAFVLWQFTPYAKRLVWGGLLLAVMITTHLAGRRRIPRRKPLTATKTT